MALIEIDGLPINIKKVDLSMAILKSVYIRRENTIYKFRNNITIFGLYSHNQMVLFHCFIL